MEDLNLSNPEEEKRNLRTVNIFSDPKDIDAIILAKLNSIPVRGGKRPVAWTEEELELRDAVIMEYLTEQGLSKEKTAQQIMNRYDINIMTARRWVKAAVDRFCINYASETREEQRQIWTEMIQQILQDAIDSKSRDSALKALDMLGKSYGLYQQKNDVTIQGGETPIKFDFQ